MNKQIISSTEYLKEVVNLSTTNPFYIMTANTFRGIYIEVAKLELLLRGETLEDEQFNQNRLQLALDRLNNCEDMADFVIPALIRIMKEYREMIPEESVKAIEDALINFRYWLDEGGEINAAYFTENHQILFHTAEYIVGDMYPDTIFTANNQTGAWHKEHARIFIERWMRWRARFGFCEWTSRYTAENLLGLGDYYVYGDDQRLVNNAKSLIDTLFLTIAMYTHHGHWSGTHGRAYANFLVEPDFQAVTPLCYMYWGEGSVGLDQPDCAIMYAVYDYTPPSVITELALDPSEEIICKERISLFASEGKGLGEDPADFDNIMLYWGIQVYDAYEVINNSAMVMPPSNWMNERVNAFLEYFRLNEEAGITDFDRDPDFTAMTKANLYFYKRPEYSLSCAQDFRKQKFGYQQHPWGANLGGRAVVFTNHPGSIEYDDRPNKIAGNGVLPRAVQNKNVVLCIHRIFAHYTRTLETHAYFPQHEFDEVREEKGWLFGRKEDAYIALKSMMPTFWQNVDVRLYQNVYPDNWETHYHNALPCSSDE